MLGAALEQVERRAGVLAHRARGVAARAARDRARRRSAAPRRSRRPGRVPPGRRRPCARVELGGRRAGGAARARQRQHVVALAPRAACEVREPRKPVAPVTSTFIARYSARLCSYSNGVAKLCVAPPGGSLAARQRRDVGDRHRLGRHVGGRDPRPAATRAAIRAASSTCTTPIVARPPPSTVSGSPAAARRRNLSTTVCDSGARRARPGSARRRSRAARARGRSRACARTARGRARRRSSRGARGRPAGRRAGPARPRPRGPARTRAASWRRRARRRRAAATASATCRAPVRLVSSV